MEVELKKYILSWVAGNCKTAACHASLLNYYREQTRKVGLFYQFVVQWSLSLCSLTSVMKTLVLQGYVPYVQFHLLHSGRGGRGFLLLVDSQVTLDQKKKKLYKNLAYLRKIQYVFLQQCRAILILFLWHSQSSYWVSQISCNLLIL